jgi:hypothetical protein
VPSLLRIKLTLSRLLSHVNFNEKRADSGAGTVPSARLTRQCTTPTCPPWRAIADKVHVHMLNGWPWSLEQHNKSHTSDLAMKIYKLIFSLIFGKMKIMQLKKIFSVRKRLYFTLVTGESLSCNPTYNSKKILVATYFTCNWEDFLSVATPTADSVSCNRACNWI